MQNLDFWFIWFIFRKRWRIIIFCTFSAAIIAGVYSKLFIRPVYFSSCSLYFGRVTEMPSMEQSLADAFQKKAWGSTASQLALGTSLSRDYQQLIESNMVREKVADELAKNEKYRNKGYSVEAGMLATSRVMKLTIYSDDPVFCQYVANVYARGFIARVQKLVGVPNAQVIEEPTLNFSPISPDIKKNIAIGFVVGFVLSFALFVIIKLLDRSIRTSEEVEEGLNLPVIGTVHKDQDYTLDSNNPVLFSAKVNPAEDRTQIAEDFRVFRVNLINRKPKDQQDGSVIAVTSTHAKEGKTFCTANLGAALAEAGYKVLLVDCDTGKRGLQSILGKSDDKGLMNILSEESTFEETVKHNLNDMKMDVLFCGNPHVNSANLMVSPKFKQLMDKLKKQYDYAFLDVSCHLGTADIVSAGSTADSVLLLVRAGKTDSETVQQTVDALKRANLDVSGVILNGVEEERK